MKNIYAENAPGWADLVRPIVEAIKEYNKEYPDNYVEICQIKEKFAGLRFYTSPAPEYIRNMIREAEDKSYHICQNCGRPGETVTIRRWMYTFCPECKEKTEQKISEYYEI